MNFQNLELGFLIRYSEVSLADVSSFLPLWVIKKLSFGYASKTCLSTLNFTCNFLAFFY